MKLKFSIASKISAGYGILIIFWLINIYISNNAFDKSEEIRSRLISNYQPAHKFLIVLTKEVSQSDVALRTFISADTKRVESKKRLTNLHMSYIKLKAKLSSLSQTWETENKSYLINIFSEIDSLFINQEAMVIKFDELTVDSDSISFKSDKSMLTKSNNIFMFTNQIIDKISILNEKLSMKVAQDNQTLLDSIRNMKILLTWSGITLAFLILILSIATIRAIVSPINRLKKVLTVMSFGELPDKPLKVGTDEIGEMGKALNNLIGGLKKLSAFSKEIGKENYSGQFEPLGNNDELGNSLLLMRDNLKKAFRETMIRRKENFQRSWTSQGLAEFGEMLRESQDNLEELTNKILTKLIRYLDASIGGLFIINDDNKDDVFLELIAFYAYDRRKYLDKHIKIGESLVGQCVLENETIFMSEIPKDYIHISSGSGKDDPRSLLIVPLKLNEEVYGVVELASFKKIEQFQIEFVEKIGESIASTISSAKINIHTSKLLQESNEKSQRLTKQEEESRRQIEDMEKAINDLKKHATTEREQNKTLVEQYKTDLHNIRTNNEKFSLDNNKLLIDIKNLTLAMDNAIGTYSLSINGDFIEANDKYLQMVALSLNELKEKKFSELISDSQSQTFDMQNFIPNLLSGQVYRKTTKYLINNESRWLHETFTPLYDENGKFSKILCLVINETDETKTKIEQQSMIEKLKADLRKIKQRIV